MALEHRLQVLLAEEQYQRLARAARIRRTSVGALIREAIDQSALLGPSLDDRKALLEKILSAPPMPVPLDPQDLRRELDDAHDLPRR